MHAHSQAYLALTTIALVTASPRLQAATYTNFADFTSAVLARGYQTDTIIPGGNVSYQNDGVSIDGVSLINSDYNKFSGELPVDFYAGQDPAGQGSLIGGLGLSPVEILLPADTYALGYEVKDETGGGGFTFMGEVSDTPITSRTLMAQGGSSDYLLIRQVTFAPAAAPSIPEASALSLAGLGFVGVLFAVRRRRA